MGNYYWEALFVPRKYTCLHCDESIETNIDYQIVKCGCGKMELLVSEVRTREYDCKLLKDYVREW